MISWWWSGVDPAQIIEDKIEPASYDRYGMYIWTKVRVDTCKERCCGLGLKSNGFQWVGPMVKAQFRWQKYWKPGSPRWHKCHFTALETGARDSFDDRIFPDQLDTEQGKEQLTKCGEQAIEAAGLTLSSPED
jgi:hypothetical protein